MINTTKKDGGGLYENVPHCSKETGLPLPSYYGVSNRALISFRWRTFNPKQAWLASTQCCQWSSVLSWLSCLTQAGGEHSQPIHGGRYQFSVSRLCRTLSECWVFWNASRAQSRVQYADVRLWMGDEHVLQDIVGKHNGNEPAKQLPVW